MSSKFQLHILLETGSCDEGYFYSLQMAGQHVATICCRDNIAAILTAYFDKESRGGSVSSAAKTAAARRNIAKRWEHRPNPLIEEQEHIYQPHVAEAPALDFTTLFGESVELDDLF